MPTRNLNAGICRVRQRVRKERCRVSRQNKEAVVALVDAIANLAPPALGTLKAILMGLVIGKCLHDLLLRVEDKGPILYNRLVKRSARNDDFEMNVSMDRPSELQRVKKLGK